MPIKPVSKDPITTEPPVAKAVAKDPLTTEAEQILDRLTHASQNTKLIFKDKTPALLTELKRLSPFPAKIVANRINFYLADHRTHSVQVG